MPVPEYHNSGWVTSPGREVALRFSEGHSDEAEVARLRGYVMATMKRFAEDQRVLMWELYNEPGQGLMNPQGQEGMGDRSLKLLRSAWEWAREVAPTQPVCSTAEGSIGEKNIAMARANSDIHSFHCYQAPAAFEALCVEYVALGRPAICTEYLARPRNTFQDCLPILKRLRIGAVNWGFVSGKSGTVWPWSSRRGKNLDELRSSGVVIRPGEPLPEPPIWFHDIVRADGTPFDSREIELIKKLTADNPPFPSPRSSGAP